MSIYRRYKNKDYEDVYKHLLKSNMFDTNADIMLFAALIGLLEKNYSEFKHKKNNSIEIKHETFKNGIRERIIEMICLKKHGNIDVFKDDTTTITNNAKIIEGYAVSGIEKIQSILSVSKTNNNLSNDVSGKILEYLQKRNFIKKLNSNKGGPNPIPLN